MESVLKLKTPIMQGKDVKLCQEILYKLGYDVGEIDEKYGKKTEKAVRQFQSENQLQIDGMVGPATWKCLRLNTSNKGESQNQYGVSSQEVWIGEWLKITDKCGSIILRIEGNMSTFGGENDKGVKPNEGLALYEDNGDDAFENCQIDNLFLPEQPPGTTGSARRLNEDAWYLACRWPYEFIKEKLNISQGNVKRFLQLNSATIENPANGKKISAYPVDYGPNSREFKGGFKRCADLSPGAAKTLGLKTNERVIVTIKIS